MKAEGWACDVCDKFAHDVGGWFKVSKDGQETDVCSVACLGRLAKQLGKMVVSDRLACECGRTFGTKQGLSMHKTRTGHD